MLARFIRWFKIEMLARKLDPKAFHKGHHYRKNLARQSARTMLAAAEGQYDAIGGKP